jgi:hypothetical protein
MVGVVVVVVVLARSNGILSWLPRSNSPVGSTVGIVGVASLSCSGRQNDMGSGVLELSGRGADSAGESGQMPACRGVSGVGRGGGAKKKSFPAGRPCDPEEVETF